MGQEPLVEERVAQPYVALHREVTDGVPAAVDGAFPTLFGWLAAHDVAPAGAPFIRFLVVADDGEPVELEVGVPVAAGVAVPAGAPVRAGELPAGRYLAACHVGPYRHDTVPDLAATRGRMQAWAAAHGVRIDCLAAERGAVLGCSVEAYRVGPPLEADWTRWETDLAFLVAAG